MSTKIDARQIISRDTLSQLLPNLSGQELDNLLRSINSDLTIPLRLDASNPADLVVNVGASNISNPESDRQQSLPHINGSIPTLSSGTITFPSTSGGTITVSPGTNDTLTVASNEYVKVLIYLNDTDDLRVIVGTSDPVEADATVPEPPANTIPIGYVTLFNNAGTIDNIAQSKIYQFTTSADMPTPEALLTSLGLTDAGGHVYSSNIRGATNESFLARLGVLTDAVGDSQEDRSAYLRSDNVITWDGAQISFASDINLEIINTKSGTTTVHTIQTADSPIALNDGESLWVEIDRTAASENLTVNVSDTLAVPAQVQGDKDVFIIAKSVDEGGNQNLYIPLSGQLINEGGTVKLGIGEFASSLPELKTHNYIINGGFELWQRTFDTSTILGTSGLEYIPDRFGIRYSSAFNSTILDARRESDTPTDQTEFCLGIAKNADATPGATDFLQIQYIIEGYDFLSLHNRPITLSFYVYSHVTGTYSVVFSNEVGDRWYTAEYTIDAADTWERKTIQFTHDNTGSWSNLQDPGLVIHWTLYAGASVQNATTDTWVNSAKPRGSSNQVDWEAGNDHTDPLANRTFRIAEVILTEGINIPDFQRAGGSVAEEIELCQRYYEKSYDLVTNPGSTVDPGTEEVGPLGGTLNGTYIIHAVFKTKKRAAPTAVLYSRSSGAANTIDAGGPTLAVTYTNIGQRGFQGRNSSAGGGNSVGRAHWTGDAEFGAF